MGRPYGGCSIINRKSLVSFITPVNSCSDRFCAIKLCDSSGLSVLIICVYIPGEHNQNPSDAYLSTLGELEGFIDSHKLDVCLVIGDFNVDFNRDSCLKELLLDFMASLNLSACDLLFSNDIQYTYERDDGHVHSWIDHILCTQSFSGLESGAQTLRSGSNLSDRFPLCFKFHVNCSAASRHFLSPTTPSISHHILWSKVSKTDIGNYQDLVCQRLPKLPSDILACAEIDCSYHRKNLSTGHHSLTACAFLCFPCCSSFSSTLVGWKNCCQNLKQDADFWYKRLVVLPLVSFSTLRIILRENINHQFVA